MRMKCLAIKEEKMFRLGPRLGTFRKTRRRQQRGRGKTKDLMSRTIAQHVRLAVPCKMTTLNHQRLRGLKKGTRRQIIII